MKRQKPPAAASGSASDDADSDIRSADVPRLKVKLIGMRLERLRQEAMTVDVKDAAKVAEIEKRLAACRADIEKFASDASVVEGVAAARKAADVVASTLAGLRTGDGKPGQGF